MQKVKGNPLYLYKKFTIEKYGEKSMDEILANANPTTRALFTGIIDVNTWYDVEIFCDFLEAFDRTFGREEFKALAAFTVEKQISGVFGFVLRFVSLDKLFPRAQELWDRFYSPGKCWGGRVGLEVMIKVSEFELSDLQTIGFMYYAKSLIELIEKKEYICSFKRIDKKSVEFHYLKKH